MSIAGRLCTRQILATAQSMMLTLSIASVSGDVVPEPPKLNRKWISRWRHTWGISLRKPTKRFKVRRSILKARLLIYWSNLLALPPPIDPPPPLPPPLDPAPPLPLPPQPELKIETGSGGGASLGDPGAEVPGSALAIDEEPKGPKKAKDDKKKPKDKKDKAKKDKKHKKKKKHKKDKSKKGAVSGPPYFATDVDTEKRLVQVLTALANAWKHDKKESVLRWLARDVHEEAAKVRKGVLDQVETACFRKGVVPKPIPKGGLESLFVARLVAFPDAQRAFFLNSGCSK